MIKKWLWVVFVCVLFGCRHEKECIVRMETSAGVIRFRLYDETLIHRNNLEKLIREGFYNKLLFHRVIPDFMVQTGDPESLGARRGMLLGAKDIGYTLREEIMPGFFHKRGAVAAARESDAVNPDRNSSGSHFYIVQGKRFTPEELDTAVVEINNKRYAALFGRLKAQREAELVRYQIAGDFDNVMKVTNEVSEQTREAFEGVKLTLSDEQRKAYTTVGGAPHLDGEYTVFGEVVEGMEVVDRIAAMPTDENCRPEEDVVILRMELE